MQLLEASSEALIKPLSTVIGIVERRTTKPILSNILINKNGSHVEFVATDMDVQIKTSIEIGSGDGNHSITVLARKLHDVLRSLPSGGLVNMSVDQQGKSADAAKMSVKCGSSRFSLQTLPSADFPLAKVPEEWDREITISQSQLLKLMSMVSFAMAKQDIRYYLNGILLVIEEGKLRTVATDGHRLTHMAIDLEGVEVDKELQLILPSKTVVEMQRLLDDSDEPVKISIGRGVVCFEFGSIEFISKLVEGRFPDFRRVIPSGYEHHIKLNRDELQRSLQRAAILVAQDRLHGIKLAFEDNRLSISSHNQEQEEAKIELAIDYELTPLEVGFNVNYLLDVLAMAKTEEIIFSVKPEQQNASVLIHIPEQDEFKYVVMPLRI